MTGKFLRRTFRSVLFPKAPYFAHLAITHRCNLKCRFCHVTETRFTELDTTATMRVIDVLDQMGVAVISISGGGEPLLREDFDQIIDYAVSLGLYVKITTNGTVPRSKYQRLLASAVDEIGVSLDGVRGSDLPFSHVGPPILATLQYLHDQLPARKKLTINVTVSESNRNEVQGILDFCAEHYPRARVWLNPVVAGNGALRSGRVTKTSPDYLRRNFSPTRLTADFYTQGAEQQYKQDRFSWGCLAGDQFFDIKPNGDFWLCQDQPSPVKLNVLEPDFEQKRKYLNKDVRRDCDGCIYSCYYLVQNSFLPRNWRDVALLWWQAATEPGGRARLVAARDGWLAGLWAFLVDQRRRRAAAATSLAALCVLGAMNAFGAAQPEPEAVLDRMEQASRLQLERIRAWSSTRSYRAENQRLRTWAEATVEAGYLAPEAKTFRITTSSGSGLVLRHVIEPILEAETESASPAERALTEINRQNYQFEYEGFDPSTNTFVFKATPHKPRRYQFRGRVWIDAETFGVSKVEGQPALRPSFWVKRTDFIREYRTFEGCWLPVRHDSTAELRWFGQSTLQIRYGEYRLRTLREDGGAAFASSR